MLKRNETIRITRRPRRKRVEHYEYEEDSPSETSPSVSRHNSELSSSHGSVISSTTSSVSSSPSGSMRAHKPPSSLELPSTLITNFDNNNTTEEKHGELCLSPSKSWEEHCREYLYGNKFLNTLEVESEDGPTTDPVDSPLYVNLSQPTGWQDKWRKLSEEDTANAHDPDIDQIYNLDELDDDKDVIDGLGMSKPKQPSSDSGQITAAGKEEGVVTLRHDKLAPPPLDIQRLSSSDYTITPDGEDAYDNVPWQTDTYNAMIQSDLSKNSLKRQDPAATYNPVGMLPNSDVKQKQAVYAPALVSKSIDKISDNIAQSDEPSSPHNLRKKITTNQSIKSSTSTTSNVSSTDSGIGSVRGASLSCGDDDEMETVHSRLENFLIDMSTSKLDKMDRNMTPARNKQTITTKVRRKHTGFRTKKTRGGAMNALNEMGTKNIDPQKRYSLGDMLGQGACGTVYIARDNETGEVVAIKIVSLQQDQRQLGLIVKEIEALTTLEHTNIINYRGSYRINQALWIVMDYLEGGSLTTVIETMELDEFCIATITAECLKALTYLHSKRIIHRDIKSDNILMGSGGEVKLTDFGCCAQLHTKQAKRQTTIGTPYWMSPEAIQGKPYNEKADIWSLGILVVEMIEGTPPYMKYSPQKACQLILKKGAPRVKRQISADLEHFLKKCLQRKVEKRLSAAELLQHPFITSNALHHAELEPLMKAVLDEMYDEDDEDQDNSYL